MNSAVTSQYWKVVALVGVVCEETHIVSGIREAYKRVGYDDV